MSDPPVGLDDDRDVTRAGYRPEFRRTLGSFAAFAAGFSYLSILTGIVQNFNLGYREAGPGFFWTWPVVFAGQFCVALCFADLAKQYPLCGGIYAWSRRAGTPFVGWLTGWIYLASLIVTLAAVALAWDVVLPQISPKFRIVESKVGNAALLGSILIGLSTLINALGTRWLAAIMNVGVIVELAGAVLLIALLAAHAHRSPAALLEIRSSVDVHELGRLGPLLAAAVMAAYVMYGFDTAGTLAEETVDPRRRAPRAILQALAAAAALGALLLIFSLLSAPDLNDPKLAEDGLPYLIKQVLADDVGKVFLVASAIAIFICTLAVQANTARVLFAMARDRGLPGSAWLGQVNSETTTPTRAVVLIGLLGIALLLFNRDFENLMIALTCVCIVWANLAYLFTTGPQLVRRLRGGESPLLGRWAIPVNAAAIVWGVFLIVNIGWPRERFYGTHWYEKNGAILYTAGLVAVGLVVYAVHVRGRARGPS